MRWKDKYPNLEKFMVLEVAPVAPNKKGMQYIDRMTQSWKQGLDTLVSEMRQIASELSDGQVSDRMMRWADYIDPRHTRRTEPDAKELPPSPKVMSAEEFNSMLDESPEGEL